MSMLFEQPDPTERFRERRAAARRRRRRHKAALALLVLGAVAALALGAQRFQGGSLTAPAAKQGQTPQAQKWAVPTPRGLPAEVRGVHVTMALASVRGKLDEYLTLMTEGLNTIELDVKDENGEIGFVPSAVPLAIKIGAARPYYRPREVVAAVHAAGAYLIGRVVVFEDPKLARARPDLAIQRPDGSVWATSGGLGWTNPYDKRVWEYNVSVAEVAARMGFDEIQFDYVRFPSDGTLSDTVYPGKTDAAPGWVIAQFVQYAAKRLQPLGVRVSVDVFGLSATRDLGIGQVPRRLARYVDAIYPMTYPSHYGSGEYGIDNPNAAPGETVFMSLVHFRRELRGRDAKLIPWLQDFSLGRPYTLAEVKAQIESARLHDVKGYLLWNPLGVYTPGSLAPQG